MAQVNQSSAVNQKVRQLIDSYKGKTVWYLRLQLLKDQDLEVISKELETDNICEELILTNNHFTAVGAKHLARLLENNRTLKKIHLANNNIGDEGINALCEVLTRHNTLEELNLSNTGMTYDSGSAVARMIEAAKTLVRLDLRQENGLPPLTKRRFAEANKNGQINDLLYEDSSQEEDLRALER